MYQWVLDKVEIFLLPSGFRCRSCGTTLRQCSTTLWPPGSSQRRPSSLPLSTRDGWNWWGTPTRPRMSFSAALEGRPPRLSCSAILDTTWSCVKSHSPPTYSQKERYMHTNWFWVSELEQKGVQSEGVTILSMSEGGEDTEKCNSSVISSLLNLSKGLWRWYRLALILGNFAWCMWWWSTVNHKYFVVWEKVKHIESYVHNAVQGLLSENYLLHERAQVLSICSAIVHALHSISYWK